MGPCCVFVQVEVETFVSHCWNEPFQHFVATLGTVRLNTGVWVCSFAMPQSLGLPSRFKPCTSYTSIFWVVAFSMQSVSILCLLLLRNVDISLQLKSEPMRSPFALALLKAECVLLAVDETFEPLRRSWCC